MVIDSAYRKKCKHGIAWADHCIECERTWLEDKIKWHSSRAIELTRLLKELNNKEDKDSL